MAKSPFLEKLLDRDYEVIYFTDPVDEYVMQHLQEFDDKSFANAQKENLKLGSKDDKEKKREKALRVRPCHANSCPPGFGKAYKRLLTANLSSSSLAT